MLDDTIRNEDKRSLHAQGVADLKDLTGANLSSTSPRLPKLVT